MQYLTKMTRDAMSAQSSIVGGQSFSFWFGGMLLIGSLSASQGRELRVHAEIISQLTTDRIVPIGENGMGTEAKPIELGRVGSDAGGVMSAVEVS